MLRKLNIISGLVLFAFISTHLLNLTVGIVSLELLDATRPYFFAFWTTFPTEIILILALLLHPLLGLRALYFRNTLRISTPDKVQLCSSLLIIPLLIPHIIAIKLGESLLGVQANFTVFLSYMWVDSPMAGLRQVLLVILAWVHGCIGLLTWIKLKSWWPKIAPFAYPLVVAIPTFALLGFVEAGRDAVHIKALASQQSAILKYANKEDDKRPSLSAASLLEQPLEAKQSAKHSALEYQLASQAMARQTNYWLFGYAILIALIFMARYMRLRKYREFVEIHYADGAVITAEVGPTLLEIAILNDIPHANLCHGKGRCGTCRVRIIQSSSRLTPISNLERAMLDKLHSDGQTRLACQAGPSAGVLHLEKLMSADLQLTNTLPNTREPSAELVIDQQNERAKL
ncbi:MAG: hypothetical protein OFPII_26240 [Osedax symbiont Rs1]|nr:MAG: hypothetical protein OFPII_26240 [Osedax symbiont Rs1]